MVLLYMYLAGICVICMSQEKDIFYFESKRLRVEKKVCLGD